MSGGNWGNKLTAFGVVLLSTAILWFLVSDLSAVSNRYEQEAGQRSRVYAENAEREITARCSTVAPRDQTKCVADTDQTKRENQRDEQDLAAQKVTAWWTRVMGVAALVGMALSAIGVWLVWTTFDETRETNRIARRTAEKELRAYLSIGMPTLKKIKGDMWQAYFPILNTGQTPAEDVRLYVGARMVEYPLNRQFIQSLRHGRCTLADIGPHAQRAQRWLHQIKESDTLALQSGRFCYYYYIRMLYTTYTGERVEGPPTQWIAREAEFDEGGMILVQPDRTYSDHET